MCFVTIGGKLSYDGNSFQVADDGLKQTEILICVYAALSNNWIVRKGFYFVKNGGPPGGAK